MFPAFRATSADRWCEVLLDLRYGIPPERGVVVSIIFLSEREVLRLQHGE
jgi:hypothetical protein